MMDSSPTFVSSETELSVKGGCSGTASRAAIKLFHTNPAPGPPYFRKDLGAFTLPSLLKADEARVLCVNRQKC